MKSQNKIKTVLITNVPAPYRVPMLRNLAQQSDIELEVIYCAKSSIDSTLDNGDQGFKVHFLHGRYVIMEKRFMHVDLSIVSLLERIRPDVVITTGFIPTYLFAFAWSVVRGVPHVAMTDGTVNSESGLSPIHRLVRRVVFNRSVSFVGASLGSLQLFQSYGVAKERRHLSRLCVHNEQFELPRKQDAADFIFCGRFLQHKRPVFAIEVARRVAEIIGRKTTINFVGQGAQEEQMRAFANTVRDFVDVRFQGYATQVDLPKHYAESRIFLFPSEWDPWGLVANEACAAGLPVVVSPHAGVAGELIQDGVNGYVRSLDVEEWSQVCANLILNEGLYESISINSRKSVVSYTFSLAAEGVAEAIRQATGCHMKSDGLSQATSAAVDGIPLPRTEEFGSPGKNDERRVCIIQAVAKNYRLPFFDQLYLNLKNQGVALQVIYSNPIAIEELRHDSIDLPSEYGRKVKAYWLFNEHLLYQPVLQAALASDLVIGEQASKYAMNYLFAGLSALGLIRFAYWGHGRNWQKSRSSIKERIKSMLVKRADWWFAYTPRVADYVGAKGFCRERITVVQNSVELTKFRKEIGDINVSVKNALRTKLGIGCEDKVAIYCGSMHPDKKLEFLIEAAVELRSRVPSFHMIFIGAGAIDEMVREAASKHHWMHYVGPKFGVSKAKYYAISDVFLCPGQVGLAILEAFTAALPLITTDISTHSPEIDYLDIGVNGLMTEFDSLQYVQAIAECLSNPTELSRLSANAEDSSHRYSLTGMVDNFSQGILACLNRS